MNQHSLNPIHQNLLRQINLLLKQIYETDRPQYRERLREIMRSDHSDEWKTRHLQQVRDAVTALVHTENDEWKVDEEDSLPPPSILLTRQNAEEKRSSNEPRKKSKSKRKLKSKSKRKNKKLRLFF